MIVGMKKAAIYVLQPDRDKLLETLQECGEFMAITPETAETASSTEIAHTAAAINAISKYQGKQPLLASKAELTAEELFEDDSGSEEDISKARAVLEKIAALNSQVISNKNAILQLMPWIDIQGALCDIRDTVYSKTITGYCQDINLEALLAALKETSADVEMLGSAPEGKALFIVYHISDEEKIKEALKIGFSHFSLPDCDKTCREMIDNLNKEAASFEEESAALEGELAGMVKELPKLKIYYDRQKAAHDRRAVQLEGTDRAIVLIGWVRADRTERLEAAVRKATDIYAIELTDPEEDDQPPTFCMNNKVVTPFEMVTDLYSRPLAGGYDPNVMMAPFYFLFFGMMVSDAGYGLVMTVLMILCLKIVKPKGTFGKLVGVLLFGSISTVIWGALFGGYFGISLKPLMFNPMLEPMKMLILCYVLGAIHIFTGMFIRMYLLFKQGNWFSAVFDHFMWIVLIVGLVLMVFPAFATLGTILAIVGAGSLLLTQGRSSKTIVGKLGGGLYALYGITSYLGDILSYSRLFALGLATGVIGMVFNTIAMMLGSIPVVGIIFMVAFLVFGHVFNIALNALGAFVHTSRLQYIEFFGKFYDSGGKEFKPLALRPKYINIKE